MTESAWQQKFSKAQTEETQDNTLYTLVLVSGEDMEGKPQWAYALIPADNYLSFKVAEQQGEYSLADYGRVLSYGEGSTPPDDIRHEMNDTYGANPEFEAELERLWEEASEEIMALAIEEAEKNSAS